MFPAAIRFTPWLPATVLAVWCGFFTGVAAEETPATKLEDVEFTLKIQPRSGEHGKALPLTDQDLARAKTTIGKRIKAWASKKAAITIRKPSTLLVRIPSLTNEQEKQIRQLLTKVVKLELREVHQLNNERDADGKTLAQRVAQKLEIVPGYRAYIHSQKDDNGKEIQTPILLSRRVALSNRDIAQAFPSPQQADAVAVSLNGPGTDKMIAFTSPMQPGRARIAIVLDGEILSAPVVHSVPLGKNFIIEGLNEPGEVQSLASALMNPLENAIEITEMRVISNPPKQ